MKTPSALTIAAGLWLLLCGCQEYFTPPLPPPEHTDGDFDGYTPSSGDCDDGDPGVHPGGVEVSCDGVDNDCDGTTPDEPDVDGDGYSTCDGLDCDDGDAGVHPGADETPCDGVDNDCDVATDDTPDGDGDGYSVCEDCDDGDADINPGQPELPCDGEDTDCDGELHPDEVDDDGDGWSPCQGDCDDTDVDANPADGDGDLYSTCGGDCDDTEATSNPSAVEICNGVDDNCNGPIDEDCFTCDIRVPIDFPTIQSAIFAALPGEVICVGPGTYLEDINFLGKGVQILGRAGITATAIQGTGSSSVVTIANGEPPSTLLAGFMISGGVASQGGGVYVENASPTLVALLVAGNQANFGGGIYVRNSSALMWDLSIEQNSSVSYGGGVVLRDFTGNLDKTVVTENFAGDRGGGLLIRSSTGTLHALTVFGNGALQGGGVYLETTSGLLDHVVIENNVAAEGGGVYIEGSDTLLYQCLVHENLAQADGGGLHIAFGATPELRNSIIVGNSSVIGGGVFSTGSSPRFQNVGIATNQAVVDGGGIHINGGLPMFHNSAIMGNAAGNSGGGVLVSTGQPGLENTIITGNTASGGGGIFVGLGGTVIEYCDVWGNSPDQYSGMADPTGTDGNLSEDPLFLDISSPFASQWNLHLDPASPVIGQGVPTITDPDGSPGDMGFFGGPDAAFWDVDMDGYPVWWQPGPYDYGQYPGEGWDCDDWDDWVFPGQGC